MITYWVRGCKDWSSGSFDCPFFTHLFLPSCRVYSSRYQRNRLVDSAVPHHRLPRKWIAVRLPQVQHLRRQRPAKTGLLVHIGPVPSAHRDLRHAGQAGHRTQRPEEQKHPGEKERILLHRRPGTGCQIQQVPPFELSYSQCGGLLEYLKPVFIHQRQ